VPVIAPVHSELDIETAIIALGREPRSGLVVSPDIFMFMHPIISVAARKQRTGGLWAMFYARDGGLLSYGRDSGDNSRRAATYVDSHSARREAGDLPVQFPTKCEMVVNLKTAKALGINIPATILARADEVIE
jgi:putative tryptophan/tyrosine transport system substrate-binding protein